MKTLRWVAAGIAVFGFACWFAAPLCLLWLSRTAPPNTQFPLAELRSVGVDSLGLVYCISDSYRRLQVYDSQGRFLRGWYVDSPVSLLIDDVDHIRVRSRGRIEYVFDRSGLFLAKLRSRDYRPDFYDIPTPRDDDGNTYLIRHPTIWPQVVRRTPSGAESVAVTQPFYLWLVSAPVPAWLFLATGLVTLMISDRRKRRPCGRRTRAGMLGPRG